jgi:serine/threonine protein kinase
MLPDAALPAVGQRIAQYEIQETLGQGGMGVVYKASDTRLGRSVALKFFRAQFSHRWEREARAVAALNHPHIATLYEVGDHEGSPYLAMELIDGRPLKGPLPVKQAIEYAGQILDALDAAHRKGHRRKPRLAETNTAPEGKKPNPESIEGRRLGVYWSCAGRQNGNPRESPRLNYFLKG